ncbi:MULTISPECIES: hypothetical protein [Pseudanabaena]|uniref:hypothetical protein n=1 Tax=Pseudanabaena TaxID=1152 RepID=UPI00247936D6|nr:MULTISPECIES: hypothetical protein [Pseudanabaena]MEA5487623.1 hypothetical protein [Pseudanabaena sp. CCNP1317]WGS75438.1 hypothetical protein OA858_26110 [Pseudanabaena galeata CCNP1313]
MTSQKDHVCNTVDPKFTTKGLAANTLTTTELVAQTFASFFPYSWNFIYAKNIDRTSKPEWKTETRYPITGRRLYDYWADNETLIGVRFDNQTEYAMLDIDKGSPYHPNNNYEKFKTVLLALEDIGLVRPLIVQSSHSEGLHIYYPLWQEVPSFGIACAIKSCLQKNNCEIASGIIESFPNTKKYDSEYNGHRLPLQTGSYQLDNDLQIIGRDLNQFVETWLTVQEQQDIDLLKQAIAEAKANYQPPKDNRKTIQWREDLEKQIQQGWTGQGQSNELLYLMGKYARVFLGCEEDEAIVEYITKTARAAAGFLKFCGDIKRLEQKAKDIAKWCMKNHFPFGSKKGEQTENENEKTETQKAQKQAERLERIRTSVNELNKAGEMPETIRGMAQAIAKTAKVSVETLYENKQIWHPEFTETSNSINTNNSAPSPTAIAPPNEQAETQTESSVTEKALYKALASSETPLRGQELPKFANVDFQVATDLPKSPQKTSDPMWIETHGRLSQPKAEISKVAISQNLSPKTANADCLRPYQPPKSEPMSAIGSRIGYLKALLETPILRRSKSASEIASLQAELERLERDRQTYSSP